MLYGNNCMQAVVNNMIVLPDNKFIYVSSFYSFNSFYNCFNFPCIYFVIILIPFCVKHFEFP